MKAVSKDPELRMSRGENKALALCKGHPDREEIRFDLCGGNVVVECPDGPTVEKMREIASALGVKPKSDDGEGH